MKPSERKQQLVGELANLYEELDIKRLYGFPSQRDTQKWLADVASVLKNLDESDYQELVRLSKTVGLSESREERKKAAQEINQFLVRKVAEWKRYDFSSLDTSEKSKGNDQIGIVNTGTDNVYDLNSFDGLGIGILDKGQRSKASGNKFQGQDQVMQNLPKLKFGETSINGQPGGGGSVFLNGHIINIGDTARISADGGGIVNSTSGNNSPIVLHLGQINDLITKLEMAIDDNYDGGDKDELKDLAKELKVQVDSGNESKFKQIAGVILSRTAEVAQITSLVVQLLVLGSSPK